MNEQELKLHLSDYNNLLTLASNLSVLIDKLGHVSPELLRKELVYQHMCTMKTLAHISSLNWTTQTDESAE